MKKLLFIIVLFLGLFSLAWMQATTIPQLKNQDNLTDMFGSHARILDFLTRQSSGLANGKLELTEAEFNSLVKVALSLNPDGQKLLAISERIISHYHTDSVEIGAVINLDKVRQIDQNLHQTIQKFKRDYPFMAKKYIYLAVKAKPVAKNGRIVLAQNMAMKLGKLPIPAPLLNLTHIDMEQVQQMSLSIRKLHISDVSVSPEGLSVRAKYVP